MITNKLLNTKIGKSILKKTIEDMSDTDAFSLLHDLMTSKIKLGVAYLSENGDGLLTHQVLTVAVGDIRAATEPEALDMPFRPSFERPKETTLQ